MTRPSLTVVRPGGESPAQAAARVQAEARTMANAAYADLLAAIEAAAQACADVQALESIPNGVRNEGRVFIRACEQAVRNMTTIKARV